MESHHKVIWWKVIIFSKQKLCEIIIWCCIINKNNLLCKIIIWWFSIILNSYKLYYCLSDTFQIIKIILDIKSQNWTPPKKKKKNYLRWQRQRGIKNAAEYGKGPESVTEQIRDTCPANWGRLKATSWRKDTNPISDISGNTKAQLDCANSRQIGTLTVKCKRLLCGHKSRVCCPSFLHQYQYFP